MRACPECGHKNPETASFCGECGQRLPSGRTCDSCTYAGNPPQATFCIRCGAPLNGRSYAGFIWAGGVAVAILVAAVIALWQTGTFETWLNGDAARLIGPVPTATMERATEERISEAANTPTESIITEGISEAGENPTESTITATSLPPTDTAPPPPTSVPTPTPEPLSPTPTSPPTETPTPTPRPTETSTPTAPARETPTTTPRPQLLVEGAESYSTAVALNAAYQINDCWDANEAQLSLAGPLHVGGGHQAIAFWFNIRQAPPNDYAGFERFLTGSHDWSGYSHLCLWTEHDGSINDIVLQFGEKGGEVWKHYLALSPGARESCVPLSEDVFVHADWSAPGNGRVDLPAIDYYGVYVHRSQPGSGTVYLDDLRVVTQ
jgi:ribosomal protein L40E